MKHKKLLIVVAFPLTALFIAFTAFAGITADQDRTKQIYKPTGNEGVIEGTISFAGEPPKPRLLDMGADPVCAELNPASTSEDVLVNDAMIANVLVYVKSDRLDEYAFEAPTSEVVLEHKNCQYAPHVLGIQTEQTLKITNRDATVHNTHPTPKVNKEWNQSQRSGAAIEQRFARPEMFIPFKDNQHPWEKAYLSVLSHPFFAVTERDGSYRISGLPPGVYTVVARHEQFGEQQAADVVVRVKETTATNFIFQSAGPSAP